MGENEPRVTAGPGVGVRSSGPSGTDVSELALGSWNTWNRSPFDEVVETLRIAWEGGVRFFDVGIYGDDLANPNENSTDIVFARAMAQLGVSRDSYRLAAKGWLPEQRREVAPLREQLEALLRRHGTDYADFLVLGDLMVETDDYSSILDGVGALIAEGKAHAWAVNNWAAAEIADISRQAEERGIPAPDFAQLKYGPARRTVPEGEPFEELCRSQGLTIQASESMEGGLLLGATGGGRLIGGNVAGIHDAMRSAVGRLREAAATLGATPAQLCIALPLTNQNTSSVVVGARTPQQIRDDLGAMTLLAEHSAETIREVASEFWFDRDLVSPDASWGTRIGDDASTYFVVPR